MSPSSSPAGSTASATQQGILFMLLATAGFSGLDVSAKWVGQQLPIVEVIWGRYVFHLLIIVVLFGRGRPRRLLRTGAPRLQLARALTMVGATVAAWIALKYLPVADVTTISFAAPLLLTALSVPLLQERVGPYRWGAVIVGLVGVLVAMRPGQGALNPILLLPLFAALSNAFYQIVTRLLSRVDQPGTTHFYTALGGVLMSGAALPFVWVTPTFTQWLWFAWLGCIGAAGHYCLVRAFGVAPPAVLGPFSYSQLVWAILLGWLVFGNLPDGRMLLGAAIIVASGLFILYRERVIARRGR